MVNNGLQAINNNLKANNNNVKAHIDIMVIAISNNSKNPNKSIVTARNDKQQNQDKEPLENEDNSIETHEAPSESDILSFGDIMASDPKFMIFSILSMYPAQSLTELSKITGKSKSTLSVHLSQMVKAGVVEVSKKEKVRGNIPAKYFRLVPNFEEKLAKKKECSSCEPSAKDYIEKIQYQRVFAQTQVQMLEKWIMYLDHLSSEINHDHFEALKSDLDEIFDKKKPRITIVSFYTDPAAKSFLTDLMPNYGKAEKLNMETVENQEDPVHPHYVGVQILPMKKAIDHFLDQ